MGRQRSVSVKLKQHLTLKLYHLSSMEHSSSPALQGECGLILWRIKVGVGRGFPGNERTLVDHANA